METKKWYQSKLVGVGILQTLIGFAQLLQAYLVAGNYSPEAVVMLVSGFLTIVLRVWYTDTVIK